MQLSLPFRAPAPTPRGEPARELIVVGRRPITVTYVRHPRARHYLLRVEPDGGVRVTIPRGGSRAAAARFVREKARWIEQERYRAAVEQAAGGWLNAESVLLSGERLELVVSAEPGGRRVRFGGHDLVIAEALDGVAPAVEAYLRRLAARELPLRLVALAAPLGHQVRAVTVRSQRSRWGSCSPSGRISLNWRLIQMPPHVCDYILLHELSHLRHPDHSRRFWQALERACPWHREARAWLRGSAGAVTR